MVPLPAPLEMHGHVRKTFCMARKSWCGLYASHNSSRTKLRVTATFVNTFGEATHKDEFEFGKSSN